MPDEFHGFSDNSLHRVITVMVAIRAREDDDSELHRCSHTMRNSSMTGFVRTSFASFCTTSRPLSAETPSAMFTSKYLPCRTSATSGSPMDSTLRWIVIPWGSSTVGFSVTITVAFMRSPLFQEEKIDRSRGHNQRVQHSAPSRRSRVPAVQTHRA